MAGDSVFDSSFQTALPQLNTEKQLMAMLMRNNALNFKPVIDSLKGVGKVFSDAEDNLKKANTSAAQRYLENMSWEDRLALEKKGDPLMTLAQEGIPLNLADAELNKAYSDSRTKARKDKTADWVATKLPMIGYNDWVSYMKGDNPYLFSSYGVDEDMDFVNNPDLRKAVEDSMQNNANRFLMDFDASHNITPMEAIRENKTIDQLRYDRATNAERSVLTKATKEPADLQTRTNDLADIQRQAVLDQSDPTQQGIILGKVIEDPVNGSLDKIGQERSAAFTGIDEKNADEVMKAWVEANFNPNDIDYKEAIENQSLDKFIDVYALKHKMSDRDREDMRKLAKSKDVKSYINVDPNKGLSKLDPKNAVAEFRRLEKFDSGTAKAMKDNTINNLAEGVRKSLTDEERKQLENPNPKVVQNLTVQLYKDYADYYGVNEDSDYFKEFIAPAIDKALAGRQEIAQRDANAELQAKAKVINDNLKIISNSNAIQYATGGGNIPPEDVERAVLNTSNLKRISKHRATIKDLLPEKVKRIYESTSSKGKDMILSLALGVITQGDLNTFDSKKDDDIAGWLSGQEGNQLLLNSDFIDTAKAVREAFPSSSHEKSNPEKAIDQ